MTDKILSLCRYDPLAIVRDFHSIRSDGSLIGYSHQSPLHLLSSTYKYTYEGSCNSLDFRAFALVNVLIIQTILRLQILSHICACKFSLPSVVTLRLATKIAQSIIIVTLRVNNTFFFLLRPHRISWNLQLISTIRNTFR